MLLSSDHGRVGLGCQSPGGDKPLNPVDHPGTAESPGRRRTPDGYPVRTRVAVNRGPTFGAWSPTVTSPSG